MPVPAFAGAGTIARLAPHDTYKHMTASTMNTLKHLAAAAGADLPATDEAAFQ